MQLGRATAPPAFDDSRRAALEEPLTLGRELGTGAIAQVRLAVGQSTHRRYAVKQLHARHARDERATARFEREAELTSRLQHRNIVKVYGVRPLDGRPALVMELVDGPTLATALARHGPMPREMILEVAAGIAAGLAYAHACGVVHRDLKPANILLSPRRPNRALTAKIADFGMARAASFANADRRALTVLGTPPYMAPECLDPLAVDPRTDLYALGCILFELATGTPPYSGPTPQAVLTAHRDADVPELPEHFGPELNDLVRRLLAKAPGERPQAAGPVADALTELGSQSRALARTDLSRATDGRCAGCGADVLAELRVCFRCGMVQVFVEPGPYSVFVTGPGELSHKLATGLRDKLVHWVRANAAAGLDATPLERRIPRLAFPLALRVSEMSGQTMVHALRHLGIHAEVSRGGPANHHATRQASTKLLRRALTVFAAFSAFPMLINPVFGAPVTFTCLLAGLPAIAFASRRSAFRPALNLRTEPNTPALPSALSRKLHALHAKVPALAEVRHRDALRAVVHRVVGLTRDLPEAVQRDVDDEMARAVELAAAAATRMDALDAHMSHADFDPARPADRALMQERDMWSARLLDLTATLDALAAREVFALNAQQQGQERATLEDLRAMVESLEEVHKR